MNVKGTIRLRGRGHGLDPLERWRINTVTVFWKIDVYTSLKSYRI